MREEEEEGEREGVGEYVRHTLYKTFHFLSRSVECLLNDFVHVLWPHVKKRPIAKLPFRQNLSLLILLRVCSVFWGYYALLVWNVKLNPKSESPNCCCTLIHIHRRISPWNSIFEHFIVPKLIFESDELTFDWPSLPLYCFDLEPNLITKGLATIIWYVQCHSECIYIVFQRSLKPHTLQLIPANEKVRHPIK